MLNKTVMLFEKIKSQFGALLLITILSFPFLAFLFKVSDLDLPNDFLNPLAFTFYQAFLSLILCWIFAVPASLGLLSAAQKRYYSLIEWLYLLPLFLPPLVIAGGLINILEFFSLTPFGLYPLLAGHVISYSGCLAVVLARIIMSKSLPYYEWAVVHGIYRWNLIRFLFQFVLRRDVQVLSLTVFSFCFTSFSLPILLSNQTLEVVIYDYLKNLQDWPFALGLLLIEICFIFIVSFYISKPVSYLKKIHLLPHLEWKAGLVFGIFPLLFIVLGLFEGLFYVSEVIKLQGFLQNLITSLFLSLSVGLIVILFFTLIALNESSVLLKKFLIGYCTPSFVLTGFSFLIFFNEKIYFSWICGLVLLFVPILYRLAGESFLSGLGRQIQAAQTLGADRFSIFKKVIWPQCQESFCFLGGLAGFWACGDFAYTVMTSQGESHLALLAHQLLGRYRVEQGLAVIWILLLAGSLCFLFFTSLSMVKIWKEDSL